VSVWKRHLCNLFGKDPSRVPKSGEFKCPICGDIVPLSQLLTHAVADDARFRDGRIIARIKQDHPNWVEADGACPRCIEHYRKMADVQKPEVAMTPKHDLGIPTWARSESARRPD
jgi:hypothetical protein